MADYQPSETEIRESLETAEDYLETYGDGSGFNWFDFDPRIVKWAIAAARENAELKAELTDAIRDCDIRDAQLAGLKVELAEAQGERDLLTEKTLQQDIFVNELYEHHKISVVDLREYQELGSSSTPG